METCQNAFCGGVILEPNTNYGYGGKICCCPQPFLTYHAPFSNINQQSNTVLSEILETLKRIEEKLK